MSGIDFTAIAGSPNLPDAAQKQKLEKSAQDFEGLLLGTLWKSMGEDMKDSFEGDSAGSSFLDMGLQAVGNAMAKNGGIGISRMILKRLEKEPSGQENKVHEPR
ncbi:MAG TPA: rod-binding protein [Candidatus Angelobacter sp.]|jgi:Rod binding domain-containing protein|nr:rod-binding protein [Candidatus Angelobacter sp.]